MRISLTGARRIHFADREHGEYISLIGSKTMKRILFALFLVAGFALPALAADIPEAKLNKAGLHIQPWFSSSTGDLAKDLELAQADGKTLAVLWEQEGCSYCLKMHKVNFRDHKTVDYVKKNFRVVQMNLRGENKVTDFNGKKLAEDALAAKHRITGTPMIEFYKTTAAGAKEVFRMPGFADLPLFTMVFEYVNEGGYAVASLGTWLKARTAQN